MTTVDMHAREVVHQHLSAWAEQHQVPAGSLDRLFEGIDGTDRGRADKQGCLYLFPGLTAKPWHDKRNFGWTAELERAFPRIKAEFLAQHDAGLGVHPEADQLASSGAWDTYHFYWMAESFDDNLARCPATAAALRHVPGIADAGMAYFSAMQPGTRVKPHSGFINARIRCHLGLVVPDDCWIRVGDQVGGWVEGECIVFDDSFEHEVEIGPAGWRAVLLLDTWHPELTEVEVAGLTHLMHTWRELFA